MGESDATCRRALNLPDETLFIVRVESLGHRTSPRG